VIVEPSGSQASPTWLYSRGRESVRIVVREQGSALSLLVQGPGPRRRVIECGDRWSLIERQIAEEARLLALGYTLERFTSDRRRQPGRRGRAASGKILRHRERSRS
jgi:hypothetical protein